MLKLERKEPRRTSFLEMLPEALAVPLTLEIRKRSSTANRPEVPATVALRARSRSEEPSGNFRVPERGIALGSGEDGRHHLTLIPVTCQRNGAAAMAPRMNQVISTSRSLGDDHSRPQRHHERMRWLGQFH
jgi:hypothetical protein